MPKPAKLYWDACVFLSLIEGTVGRIPVIEGIIDEQKRGDVEIYTSAISIAEVAFAKAEKDNKILDPAVEATIDKLWQPASPFKIVDAYSALMFDAKSLMREAHGEDGWALKPADAIHLVTAKKVGADVFQTYDDKLWKYSKFVDFRVEEPKTNSIVWPEEDDTEENQE